MIDTKQLRKLAEAATPGPWVATNWGNPDRPDSNEWYVDTPCQQADMAKTSCCDIIDHNNFNASNREESDCKFIAAVNPSILLSLLDKIDAQAEALSKIADLCEGAIVVNRTDQIIEVLESVGVNP